MPNYDLSSANLARVADQKVDLLRIANQDVWKAPSNIYTVFDGAPLSLDSYSDSPVDTTFLMNQFYRYPGQPLEVFEIGMYVPESSSLLGRIGYVGVQVGTGFLKGQSYTAEGAISTKTPTQLPLVVGWNWHSLSAPKSWTDDQPYILAGYTFEYYYLYSQTVTREPIPSTGNKFELIQQSRGEGFPERGWYSPHTNDLLQSTTSVSYGIDIRVRDA